MATILPPPVTNAAELNAAIAAAKGGERIRLAAGDWPMWITRGPAAPGAAVTLEAATRRKTVMAGVGLNYAKGLVFEGLKFKAATDRHVVTAGSAERLRFQDCAIVGAAEDGDAFFDRGMAATVRFSRDVVFAGCDVGDLYGGIAIGGSQRVVIENSRFASLREGVQISDSSDVTVRGSEFTEFQPRYDLSEHPDAIQMWSRGADKGCQRVVIEGNRIVMGGQRPVQGIFFGAENGNKHVGTVVRGNLYYGSAQWAICLAGTLDGEISGNVVLPSPHAMSRYPAGQDDGRTGAGNMGPLIAMRLGSTGQVFDNVAPYYMLDANIVARNNRLGWPAP